LLSKGFLLDLKEKPKKEAFGGGGGMG